MSTGWAVGEACTCASLHVHHASFPLVTCFVSVLCPGRAIASLRIHAAARNGQEGMVQGSHSGAHHPIHSHSTVAPQGFAPGPQWVGGRSIGLVARRIRASGRPHRSDGRGWWARRQTQHVGQHFVVHPLRYLSPRECAAGAEWVCHIACKHAPHFWGTRPTMHAVATLRRGLWCALVSSGNFRKL